MSGANPDDLKQRLSNFVEYRSANLKGDEKGEAQVFLDRLFQAFGHRGVFEAGATLEERIPARSNGGTSFADLMWKPRVLVEMKKAGRDLSLDYQQAFNYWLHATPDRPRYVVLCNFDEFWIYDLETQVDDPVEKVSLSELPERFEALAFLLPVEEEPIFSGSSIGVTRDTAAHMSELFNRLVDRGIDREDAQLFTLQCVITLFAEDIGLLPRQFFSRAIKDCEEGGSAYDLVFGLFREMNEPGVTSGGRYAGTPYFNGGVFRDVNPIDLDQDEIGILGKAADQDWSKVRPAVFGTLFEQSLEAAARHAYGAHFTSEADIYRIVDPTIVRPWTDRIEAAASIADLEALQNELVQLRVLDPACGCGNFLYVAYRSVRRLEKRIEERIAERRRSEGLGKQTRLTFVSPNQFFGMDINGFAVEIAKVTLMIARKLAADELGDERSVLPLDDLEENFEVADSALSPWFDFDVCIGNPPYLGRRKLRAERGADYVAALKEAVPTVAGVSDYVSYWFQIAHDRMPAHGRCGLVGTNTIRQGDTKVATLDYIVDNGGVIFDAVSSQPWDGDANVHVSIVNWARTDVSPKYLWVDEGSTRLEVESINTALSTQVDLKLAKTLGCNTSPKRCFQGQTPGLTDAFVVSADEARALVSGDSTATEVLFPFLGAEDLLERAEPSRFIIDFPDAEAIAAQSRAPGVFSFLQGVALEPRREAAKAERVRNEALLAEKPKANVRWHNRNFAERWWQLSYRRAEMLEAISGLDRYVVLGRVATAKRRSFYVFVSSDVRPGDSLQVFAIDDDYSFGILQSDLHERWFLERCSTLGSAPRFTSKTVWDSFPWPQSPSEQQVRNVVDAVSELLAFRNDCLGNGMGLAQQYDSLRNPGANALRDLQDVVDRAVIDAYGFDPEEDGLTQLLALNQEVADLDASGLPAEGPGPREFDGVRATDFSSCAPFSLE